MKDKKDDIIKDSGNAMKVQCDQIRKAEENLLSIKNTLADLSEQGEYQDLLISTLSKQLDILESGQEITEEIWKTSELSEFKQIDLKIPVLRLVEIDDKASWNDYIKSLSYYGHLEHLELSSDPFLSLMSKRQQEEFAKIVQRDYYERKANCDRYDYSLAVLCGLISAVIDIFFVGMPGNSQLENWSDELVDNFVISFAQKLGWNPKNGNETSIDCAIGFFERKFSVNYDQTSIENLGNVAQEVFNLNTKNHHMKSLAHSPDLIGLLFSVIGQFRGTSSFIDNGRIITFDVEKQELIGSDFISKIFSAIVNWFGHCISDVAGSKATRKKGVNMGMGIPIPGFEIFQFLKIPIKTKDGKQTIADLAVEVFENGYDFRFGLALQVPVRINNLLVRFCFALKRFFYHQYPLKECMPFDGGLFGMQRQPELRRMMLVAHGVLCVCDTGDAVIRGGGDPVTILLRTNYFAYLRLAYIGLGEVRAIYRQNHLNLKQMKKDIDEEWTGLYESNVQTWRYTGLESD